MSAKFRASLAAVIVLVSPSAVAAREVSEAELVQRTTLDRAEQARREQAVTAMTAEAQGAAMVAAVQNRTIAYYQPGHGIYVEYTSGDGRVFMWYPRNKGVVLGTWGLRDFGGPKLCYHYLNSYHCVTGEYEPTECIPPEQALVREDVLDSQPGDPFGLAGSKLPYSKSKLDVPDWPSE